jgi:mono/diheme cytochrome c family protein
MCHGEDAKGDTKAGKMMKTPDLTTEPWKQGTSVAEVVKTLREGLGKMPKYEGKISEEDLKAVAEYTLKLAKIEE